MTNAHVVAGQDDTTVQLGGAGPSLSAHAVVFDPHDDIALLRVEGLTARVLPLAADPRSGPRGRSSASRRTVPTTSGPGAWAPRAR